MGSESRVLDSFGPNLVIESNGNVGVGGQIAYQLYSVTDKGVVYQQALHGSGLATINAEQTLEIQTGLKNKSGRISYFAMAHHGDMCMTASDGWIRIKGQNIVLDATNELLLQGKRVTVGNVNKTTSHLELFGSNINLYPTSIIMCWLFRGSKPKQIGRRSGLFLKGRTLNAYASSILPSVAKAIVGQ